jgi:hypothetical protein
MVTLDDKPLPNALVTFVPEGGASPSTGTTDASGKYQLICQDRKGAVVGKHNVSVTVLPEAKPVQSMTSDDPNYEKQATGAAAYTPPKLPTIPARYNTKTELQFEVKSGSNEFNIPLKSS